MLLPLDEVDGGAILLNGLNGAVVQRCDLQHQLNGLPDNGDHLTVEDNNAAELIRK